MILASHVIFGAYGFWLPNDPRGSWSDFVGSWELFRYGPATKVTTRHSRAADPHDRQLRLAAKQALKFPPVVFDGHQALAVSQGFSRAAEESGYVFYACAILPEHVHAVIGRHPRDIKRIVGHIKGRATQELHEQALFPNDDRPVWAESCWKVYIDNVQHLRNAIQYVYDNPVKEGKNPQTWSFVRPYPFPF